MEKRDFNGFTLAEVLITLAIIGVVAVLTIPDLIQKYQVRQTVSALKEFNSVMDQAAKMVIADKGSPRYWYTNEGTGSKKANDIMLNNFRPYLRINKICFSGEQGCFPDIMYKKLDGKDAQNWNRFYSIAKFRLTNGMNVFFYSYGNEPLENISKSTAWGAISVDINGDKNPNIMGRDMFSFVFTENGVVPSGLPENLSSSTGFIINEEGVAEEIPLTDVLEGCNRTNCIGHCETCSAWVIRNENMDYLHCDDLSWDGKKSCSDK